MQLLIMKQDRGAHFKGDIVEIRASSTPHGGEEPLYFVWAEAPDVPMTSYEQYSDAWKHLLDYEVIAQNLSLDGFRLKVFSTTVSVSNIGQITKAQVEQFLIGWNASVVSFAANEVIFDFGIYNAVISASFWEIAITGVVFTELDYNQTTGVHRIQADYSALGNNPTYVERYVRGKGVEIISNVDKVMVFEITRATVLAAFKKDIKDKVEGIIRRRRYYVTSAVVDHIISQGGLVTVDELALSTYIKDKLDD